MREILFRGKHTDNGAWIEGSLIHCDLTNGKSYTAILEPDNSNSRPFEFPYLCCESGCIDGYACPIDPATVGQFTGLTDKNGKRIFEGDICRVCLDPEICTAHIQYDKRTASFNMRYNEYQCNTFLDMRLAENRVGDRVWIEVIGNIHDNPELWGANHET